MYTAFMNPHTPAFIQEMKQRLKAEKTRLEQELKQTEAIPDYGRSHEDNATEMADFAVSAATSDALGKELQAAQEALERIAAGTYGVTSEGEAIPEDRLRANPSATTLVK